MLMVVFYSSRAPLGLYLFSNACLHLILSTLIQLNFPNVKYSVYICILDAYSLSSVISGFTLLLNLHAFNDQ